MKLHYLMSLALFGLPFLAQAATNLTKKEAMSRSERISKVDYKLDFELSKQDTFSGSSAMEFNLKGTEPLRVDFDGGKVLSLTVNGELSKDYSHQNGAITVKEHLKTGKNQIAINFQQDYSKTGAGLYKFVDPEDQQIYVYSDFEPFDANKMFPSFDQPDLKARYTLTVVAPKDWTVISAIRENDVKDTKGDMKTWSFPQTLPFSTYIFSLHAGPYHKWEDQAGDIPIRLFSRKSLAEHVKSNDWFDYTKSGFKFFNEYFKYPYPFLKYDQIIVPDFNAGAMENVGAVTFSERFVVRGTPSDENRFGLANTIYHEMAHMWFGNLVTMKWWNDLWLNESFATYIAHKGIYESTKFKNAWQAFSRGSKAWAYWNDGLVVTHPIQTAVASTQDAFTNFDGITYGKGASFLKQLNFYAGESSFRQGLVNYFKENEFKNATLNDFVSSIDKQSKSDITAFSTPWLTTAGTNTLEVSHTCSKGKINLTLKQSAPKDHPTLRQHKTRIGLFNKSNGTLNLSESIDVFYSKASQSLVVSAKKCPDLVFANIDDYDFAKTIIDKKSVVFLKDNFSSIKDIQLKIMLWHELWEMVIDNHLTLETYVTMMARHLPQETQSDVVLGFRNRIGTISKYLSVKDTSKAENLKETLAKMIWNGFETSKDKNIREFYLDSYIANIRSAPALEKMLKIFEDKDKLVNGVEITLDRKWDIAIALNEAGHAQAGKLLKTLQTQDNSGRAKLNAMQFQAATPNLSSKKTWLKKLTESPKSLSVAEIKSILKGMSPDNQISYRAKLVPNFYEEAPNMVKEFPPNVSDDVLTTLIPLSCKASDSRDIDKFMKSNTLTPIVTKALLIEKQQNSRCERIINQL